MITVIFERGRDQAPVARYQGKIAFPARGGAQPSIGEEWEVVKAVPNGRGNVMFLTLGKRVSTREERIAAERTLRDAAIASRKEKEGIVQELRAGCARGSGQRLRVGFC